MVKTIVFGGGCFWCTEAVMRRLRGVLSVTSGYAGGDTERPTYMRVVEGDTGHAEVIQVEYDSESISLETLLNVFFATHDPTTKNKQGYDVGTQYRSIILYSTDEDRGIIEAYMARLEEEKTFPNKIVTDVEKLGTFYEAEKYHQRYYENNKDQRYCQFVIDPKIAKLRATFSHLLKPENEI